MRISATFSSHSCILQIIKINPLNTCCTLTQTFSEFEVAHSVFGATGIVLSIQVDVSGNLFWDCNYWSCFQNENERAFIGGYAPLEFITIRNIPMCINYEPYVKVLNIFGDMIEGYALGGSEDRLDQLPHDSK